VFSFVEHYVSHCAKLFPRTQYKRLNRASTAIAVVFRRHFAYDLHTFRLLTLYRTCIKCTFLYRNVEAFLVLLHRSLYSNVIDLNSILGLLPVWDKYHAFQYSLLTIS